MDLETARKISEAGARLREHGARVEAHQRNYDPIVGTRRVDGPAWTEFQPVRRSDLKVMARLDALRGRLEGELEAKRLVEPPMLLDIVPQGDKPAKLSSVVVMQGGPISGEAVGARMGHFHVDLSGLKFARHPRISLGNSTESRVGTLKQFGIVRGKLAVAGELNAWSPSKDEVMAELAEGRQWQAWPMLSLRETSIIKQGEMTTVNNRIVKGPALLATDATFFGIWLF